MEADIPQFNRFKRAQKHASAYPTQPRSKTKPIFFSDIYAVEESKQPVINVTSPLNDQSSSDLRHSKNSRNSRNSKTPSVEYDSGTHITQTSNLLNPEYFQQSSVLTSEISTSELISCVDAMRASASGDELVPQLDRNAIKIETFECASSLSSGNRLHGRDFKSRNLQLDVDQNNGLQKGCNFESTDVFNAA